MIRSLFFSLWLPLTVSATEIMDVHEIREGMKGIGKTVFEGTEVDSFEVEILGVMRNVRPHGDIILARLSGGPSHREGRESLIEHTGIIAGMSGSPIYIEGKLIGALAFAWPFSKEPIAGITPISEMQKIVMGEGGEGRRMLDDLKFKVKWNEEWEMVPIQTPLLLSGFEEGVFRDVKVFFESYGLLPTLGGLEGEDLHHSSLEPGSVIGVQLISGDARAGALGTVTDREGDRILAFGHPFLWSGEVNFPMTTGYIHSILPSQFLSFKMGSTGEVVGKLIQDRRAGVLGKMGEFSRMIPIEISLQKFNDSGREKSSIQKYHFEVIQEKSLTSNLSGFLVLHSLFASGYSEGEMAIETDLTLEMKTPSGEFTLQQSDLYSGKDSPTTFVKEVTNLISSLHNNPYEPIEFDEIQFTLDLYEEEERRGTLEALYVDKTSVKPGEDLQISLFYKPNRGERIRKNHSIKIPRDLPKGRVEVRVLDGKTLEKRELERDPFKKSHHDFTQFLDILRKERRRNEIWIQLVLPRKGYIIQGRELRALPPSLLSILSPSKEAGEGEVLNEEVIREERIPTEYDLSGFQSQSIEIIY